MTDTVFQSTVLLCNVGDCSCPVCNFLNGDRQTETLLHVIRVLDDKLANLEIVCTWEDEILDGYWATSCKNAWSFTDGDTPSGHKMAVCAFCGGRIIEKWSEERAWDSMSTEERDRRLGLGNAEHSDD